MAAKLLTTSLLMHAGSAIRRGRKASTEVTTVAANEESFHMRVLLGEDGACEVLEAGWGQGHRLAKDQVYEAHPEYVWKDLEEGDSMHSSEKFLDMWGPSEGTVRDRAHERCGGAPAVVVPEVSPLSADTEVRCLLCTGDSSNRIDVVFMGDGYQLGERARFFEDMSRLTRDMFEDVTFASYLPVFNIWAIHVPSRDSGIGYNGRSKDTPFGLYKQGTQHRGVFPSRNGRTKARQVCRLAGGCDYPSIIGNDEYYGGLGGEFVIGTRSKTTGTIVLRHEMGHNFVSVGEEYDGGGVYRGVNAEGADFRGEPPPQIKWKQWLSDPESQLKEQKMKIALQQYPWVDLARGRRSYTLTSDGSMARWKLAFTVSGCPEEQSLKVFLDGVPLAWTPTSPPDAERPDGHTVDRQFYYYEGEAFSKGNHTLTIESGFAPPAGAPIRQLCSLTLHEFGNEQEFNTQPGYVGAYPTWDQRGRKTFRPTNDQCLMRQMESTVFCDVCREGMWHQFFQRMTLIDEVEVARSAEQVTVELKAVPLAQLRKVPVPGLTERFVATWRRDGELQNQLADQLSFTGAAAELKGRWEVELTLITSEVRADPRKLLTTKKAFVI